MENKNGLANYQILAEKMLNLVKGENYADVENAIKNLISLLKRRSIVN